MCVHLCIHTHMYVYVYMCSFPMLSVFFTFHRLVRVSGFIGRKLKGDYEHKQTHDLKSYRLVGVNPLLALQC